jgi:hypothetical protein
MKKKHIVSLSYALGIPIIVILLGLLLPNKPIEGSLHYSIIDKTELLQNTSGPRIILVGGSNLSFGINSAEIEKQTGYHVINAAIQGSYGMRFDINHVKEYIKKGDVVILSSEYRNFFGSGRNGDKVLLYVLFDTYPEARKDISVSHWLHLSQFFPKYTVEKFNSFFKHYLMPVEGKEENVVYMRNSFNEYGDAVTHWNMKPLPFGSYKSPNGEFSYESLGLIKNFESECEKKGARLFVTFPCLQKASYDIMETKIEFMYKKLKETDLKLLGNPIRYEVEDSLLYNTAYHLNKKGVDIRTELLIQDLIENEVTLHLNNSN